MEMVKNASNTAEQMKGVQLRKKIMQKHGISTMAQMAPLVQLPLAYGFFQGLRKMAEVPVEGFVDQGTAWFGDLSQVDPYLGLQAIAAGAIIAVVRIGGETGQNAMAQNMKKIMTFIPLLSIVITKSFSAGLVLYFAANAMFSLVQALAFRVGFIRRVLGMPPKLSGEELSSLGNKSGSGNMGIAEWFSSFSQKQNQKALKAAKTADRKLEITKRRKESAKDGFIKRHK